MEKKAFFKLLIVMYRGKSLPISILVSTSFVQTCYYFLQKGYYYLSGSQKKIKISDRWMKEDHTCSKRLHYFTSSILSHYSVRLTFFFQIRERVVLTCFQREQEKKTNRADDRSQTFPDRLLAALLLAQHPTRYTVSCHQNKPMKPISPPVD